MWDEPTLVSFLIVFLLYCVVRALEELAEPAEDAAMTPASRSAAPGGGARWRG